MKCPSCGASVPTGETICLDCGTELVFAVLDEPAPEPVEPPAPAPAQPSPQVPCPDCGERVVRDDNGYCPICGHDFGDTVELDEDAFFQEPLGLDAAMDAERRRLLGLGEAAGRMAGAGLDHAPSLSADRAPNEPPSADLPLPGDRHRERYRSGAQSVVSTEEAWLMVEGGQTVFFDGRMTSQIRLDVDQVLIGRRDPVEGHYPDVDLGHFRHIDGHISRRHARVFRRQGRWFIEDLCANDATYLNDTAHTLNGESVALTDGDRVLISESVAMRFVTRSD